MLITFDTNRPGWPAPRRFHSTWRERSGDRTQVMPTVARESMPDLDVRRLARSVHETATRLGLEPCRAVTAYSAGVTEQDGWQAPDPAPRRPAGESLLLLKQWHNEIDPECNQRPGDSVDTFLHTQLLNFGLTEVEFDAWSSPRTGSRGNR